jgi:hypothetical protein
MPTLSSIYYGIPQIAPTLLALTSPERWNN